VLEVELTAAEKLYAESRGRPAEKFVLVDKIRKFLRTIYMINHFLVPGGCTKTPWDDDPKFGSVLWCIYC